MIRAHVEGHHFSEQVCRCDVVPIKREMGVNRCKSTESGCPARAYLTSMKEEVRGKHELLP